ncbi:MAG: hypothetical protein IJL79_03260 [Candidatus Methanomethylophilaceae archaeon]|nr:hypothetical protein [Candidatus Methanomethylophilaceae archaeon]
MVGAINPVTDGMAEVLKMELGTPKEREYEALATVRDILILLYGEISENSGYECPGLRDAFGYVNVLTEKAAQEL